MNWGREALAHVLRSAANPPGPNRGPGLTVAVGDAVCSLGGDVGRAVGVGGSVFVAVVGGDGVTGMDAVLGPDGWVTCGRSPAVVALGVTERMRG